MNRLCILKAGPLDKQRRAGILGCRSKLARAIKALEFYADPKTYFAVAFVPDRPCGAFIDDFDETELGRKPGKLARQVLNEIDPEG